MVEIIAEQAFLRLCRHTRRQMGHSSWAYFGSRLVIGRETDAGADPSLLQLMPPVLLLEGGSRTSVYLTEMLFLKRGIA